VDDDCAAVERALQVFGRAWAAAVLAAMLAGAQRFSEIARQTGGVSDAVLSARLRELCAGGFAERVVEPGPPVVVRYLLTDAGRATAPVLAALADFGRSTVHAGGTTRR